MTRESDPNAYAPPAVSARGQGPSGRAGDRGWAWEGGRVGNRDEARRRRGVEMSGEMWAEGRRRGAAGDLAAAARATSTRPAAPVRRRSPAPLATKRWPLRARSTAAAVSHERAPVQRRYDSVGRSRGAARRSVHQGNGIEIERALQQVPTVTPAGKAFHVRHAHEKCMVLRARVLIREGDLLLADLDGCAGAASSGGGLAGATRERVSASEQPTSKDGRRRTSASSWTLHRFSIRMK